MPDEDFNPRSAALNHAAAIAEDPNHRNHAAAIACGLIYVGDQLKALNETMSTGTLSGIANLLEVLDTTVNNRLIELAEAVA